MMQRAFPLLGRDLDPDLMAALFATLANRLTASHARLLGKTRFLRAWRFSFAVAGASHEARRDKVDNPCKTTAPSAKLALVLGSHEN
jgi:hypothetical protein